MNKFKIIFAAAALIFLPVLQAQNGLTPKTVFMYKNGYAWIVSSGNVKLNNGRWSLPQADIPNMAFGSFWFQSPAGINFVQRETDTIMRTNFQPSVEDLLRLNKGKKVKLSVNYGINISVIEGTITRIFTQPSDSFDFYHANPAVAIIKTATGNVVVNKETLAKVISAEFEDAASYDVKDKNPEAKLSVYFKTKPATTELNMVGLQKFPAWNPVYRLVLDDKNGGKLTLGAEVSCGNNNLQNAELNLVVGQPSFTYGDLLSRLVESNNNYRPEFAVDEGYVYKSVSNSASDGASRAYAPEAPEPVSVDAGKSEDFFYYTIRNFNLQKNQAAYVQILEEKINVTHQYLCQLNGVNTWYAPTYYSTLEEAPIIQVGHYLKFANPAKQPLTAGPVFVEKNNNNKDMALGQPVMSTVPVGGTANIYLTANLDLPVKQLEEELKRETSAKTVSTKSETIYFDLITVKAMVHLENQSNEEKTVSLRREVSGKPLTSDVPWTLKTYPPRATDPNSTNSISWEVKLKPGEKKDFYYTYEYYLRIY